MVMMMMMMMMNAQYSSSEQASVYARGLQTFIDDMRTANFKYPLFIVTHRGCLYVCMSASLRLNISETKGNSGFLLEAYRKCPRVVESITSRDLMTSQR